MKPCAGSLIAARAEIEKLAGQKARLIQAIKDGVPASEVKDDLAGIAQRREALEALLAGSDERLLNEWVSSIGLEPSA